MVIGPGFSHFYFTGGDNGQIDIIPSDTRFRIRGATPGYSGWFGVNLGEGTPTVDGSKYSFEFSWSEVFGDATEVKTWLYSQSSRDGVGSPYPTQNRLKVIKPTDSTPVVPDIDSSSNDIAGNTFSKARSVSVASNGKTYKGWVGENDSVDYYAFSLGATNDFKLNLTDLDADVSVQLLNTNGTVIENYNSSSTGEINIDKELGAGAYRVRVSTASDEGTDYDLNLAVTPKIAGVTGITTSGSDTVVELATAQSLPLIGINHFRSGNPALNSSPEFTGIDGRGIYGEGYTAVVIDSGIDLDHPAFGGDNKGTQGSRILYHFDFADDDPDGSDNKSGHGTGVASILASGDPRSLGVAPKANLIALKVASSLDTIISSSDGEENIGGQMPSSAIEQALQWVLENVEEYNITTVNMSFGLRDSNLQVSSNHTIYGDEFEALVNKGVILVGAAGNSFQSSDPLVNGQTGVGDVTADPNVIGVSSILNNTNGGFTNGYTIAPSSQRHPELTDIFAPGENITHAVAVNNDTPEKLSDLPRPGDVITSPELFNTHTTGTSGTSNAAPHVAGMALLAQELAEQQIYRRLDPEEFKDLLYDNGIPINSTNNNTSNNTGEYRVANMVGLARGIMSLKPQGNRTVDISGGLSVLNQNVTTGQFVNVNYVVQNNSYYDAGNVNVRFYLSKDAKIDEQDTRLIVNGSPQKYSITTGYLGGYGSQNLSSSLLLPNVNNPVWRSFNSDVGYIGMKVDYDNKIAESNEGNNTQTGIPINIHRPNTRDIDLFVNNFNLHSNSSTLNTGSSFKVNYDIRKTGRGYFNSFGQTDRINVNFYLSKDRNIDSYDRSLGQIAISPEDYFSRKSDLATLTLPGKTDPIWSKFGKGYGYIGMIVDHANTGSGRSISLINETNENNNKNLFRVDLRQQGIVSVKVNETEGDFDKWRGWNSLHKNDKSDFFTVISINGSRYTSPVIRNKNNPKPIDWIHRKLLSGVEVPISIDLYDDDNDNKVGDLGARGNNDHIDIAPRKGDKTLNFTYNLFTGEVKGDVRRENGRVKQRIINNRLLPPILDISHTIALDGQGDSDQGNIEFTLDFI